MISLAGRPPAALRTDNERDPTTYINNSRDSEYISSDCTTSCRGLGRSKVAKTLAAISRPRDTAQRRQQGRDRVPRLHGSAGAGEWRRRGRKRRHKRRRRRGRKEACQCHPCRGRRRSGKRRSDQSKQQGPLWHTNHLVETRQSNEEDTLQSLLCVADIALIDRGILEEDTETVRPISCEIKLNFILQLPKTFSESRFFWNSISGIWTGSFSLHLS